MPPERQCAEFTDAVQRYAAQLHRTAKRLCGDRHCAEDLVQDTLMRAWKSWRSLRAGASVRFWLLAILRNENLRRYTRASPWRATQDIDSIEIPASDGAHGLRELLELFERLPPQYREPLMLQVLGGFSCGEIARTLRLTEAATMTRLSRARRALRVLLVDGAERAARVRNQAASTPANGA